MTKKQSPVVCVQECTKEILITYLEMRAPLTHVISCPEKEKIRLVRLFRPPIAAYRYLYIAVGRQYYWVERTRMSDRQLAQLLHKQTTAIYVMLYRNHPAGFFELDFQDRKIAHLVYFGLLDDFLGKGFGKWLLAQALEKLWRGKPDVVRVQTCNLDHQHALPNYTACGFTPIMQVKKTMVFTAPEIAMAQSAPTRPAPALFAHL